MPNLNDYLAFLHDDISTILTSIQNITIKIAIKKGTKHIKVCNFETDSQKPVHM